MTKRAPVKHREDGRWRGVVTDLTILSKLLPSAEVKVDSLEELSKKKISEAGVIEGIVDCPLESTLGQIAQILASFYAVLLTDDLGDVKGRITRADLLKLLILDVQSRALTGITSVILYLHAIDMFDLAESIYLYALCFSALLSLLGIALTMRHKASRIPDFSIVLYVGLGVIITASTVSLLGLNLYLSPLLSLAVGCTLGGSALLGCNEGDGEAG